MRTIKKVLAAQKVNMGGIILDQPLPHRGVDQIDPFLLLHHWDDKLKGNQKQNEVGVGPHPHRGFSPVTFIFKGGVHHRDSRGHSGVVEAGGTQWMNSGMGIVHSERPSKDIAENGGKFEIIQFWVNTPAKSKMDEPSYQPLSYEDTPEVISKDGKVRVGVVIGELDGKKGKISAQTSLLGLRLDIKKGGKYTFPIPSSYNAFVYQLDGTLLVNEQETTEARSLTWFNNDGKSISIEAKEDSRAILLAGEPIKEEVTSYGPFVMNTQSEIMQALRDYQMGKMGVLIEEFE